MFICRSCRWIRATQGHYRPVSQNVQGVNAMGQEVLTGVGVHVTLGENVPSILREGLKPGGRMAVHFALGHPADTRKSGMIQF